MEISQVKMFENEQFGLMTKRTIWSNDLLSGLKIRCENLVYNLEINCMV